MARVTALALLNRVMLYRRQPTVSSYVSTNPEHFATLNALNQAKEDILSTRRWEFDLRHDGQLVTKASLVSDSIAATFTAAQGDTTGVITMTGYTASDYTAGDYVARLVPTGDTEYANTAFRITTTLPTFSFATLNFPIEMPKAFVATTCDLVYSEYLLPDTVREVVRVNYEEDEVSLNQIDPTVRFDEIYPSYSFEKGSPRSLSIGGFDTGTHFTTTDPDPKLRAIVWPIPDDAYVLSYSYYYRHPDFADGDDELVGVPPDVVNDIVWAATSIMSMAWDANFAAAHFGDMAQQMASVKHRAYGGSSARRHTVRSWDSGRSVNGLSEGFPGITIGDT
jgi:hypothetical protein